MKQKAEVEKVLATGKVEFEVEYTDENSTTWSAAGKAAEGEEGMTSNFKDFEAFAKEVVRVEQSKQDYVVPMSKVEMKDAGHVDIGGVGGSA